MGSRADLVSKSHDERHEVSTVNSATLELSTVPAFLFWEGICISSTVKTYFSVSITETVV